MIYHAFIQVCIVYVYTYHLVTWLGGLLFQYYLYIVDPSDIADSSDSRALLAMLRILAAVCARELLACATIAQKPCTPKQYRLQPFLTPGCKHPSVAYKMTTRTHFDPEAPRQIPRQGPHGPSALQKENLRFRMWHFSKSPRRACQSNW